MVTLSWIFIVCCLLSFVAGAHLFLLLVTGNGEEAIGSVIFLILVWLVYFIFR